PPPPPPLAHASIPPGPATPPAGVQGQAVSGGSPGYWDVTSSGVVAGYGVGNLGDLRGVALARPIVGMANDPAGSGYWLVASDGGVFTFGAAGFHGSTGNIRLNRPIVGMAATPDGRGYWLVASDGGIFTFGDARFFGSTGNIRLNRPVVGMAATPDGGGYWLVASDGGIFTFGDARFFGSTGNIRLNKPVVGMSPAPDGGGYRLVASDGGIFTFGDARFFGSTGNIRLAQPIVGMSNTPDGGGYWMVATDGGIFAFGDAPFLGSSGGASSGVVGMAATNFGSPYTPGSVGFDISFPQCTSGGANLPPAGSSVSIVGINDGLSAHEASVVGRAQFNPCFSTEARWAGSHLSVYVNVDNLTSPETLSQAAAFGAQDVLADVNFVHARGFFPQVWWLDVEAPCGFSVVLWRCGTTGQLLNRTLIESAINQLHALGLTAGVYSTFLQWPDITGPGVVIPRLPIWIAGAATAAQLVNFCGSPSHYFAGGTPYLVQWAGGSNGTPWDKNFACVP
ncbi:MAG: hypothetical protein J2P58_14180, partial [Acidimicrobiaceae bacterium]|nr:hypothetical protein [Acidimicrobiaceae bacterium]